MQQTNLPLQDMYALQRKRSGNHAYPMTSALDIRQTARTIPALVKTMGKHHLTTRLSAIVSIKQYTIHPSHYTTTLPGVL